MKKKEIEDAYLINALDDVMYECFKKHTDQWDYGLNVEQSDYYYWWACKVTKDERYFIRERYGVKTKRGIEKWVEEGYREDYLKFLAINRSVEKQKPQ